MVNQNKIFSFELKRQAKNVFPRDVERTVNMSSWCHFTPYKYSVTHLNSKRTCLGGDDNSEVIFLISP